MKPLLLILITTLLHFSANAQQQEFEGILHYKIDITPKLSSFSFDDLTRANPGKTITMYVRKGKFKIVEGDYTTFVLPGESDKYRVVTGSDTLYIIEPDTTSVLPTGHKAERSSIAGHPCESTGYKQGIYTYTFHYAQDIVSGKEEKRPDIWLSKKISSVIAEEQITCTKVEPKQLDDSVFALPVLPRAKYHQNIHYTNAELPGGWGKYLQRSINGDLGAKYVKIPKGAESGKVTARVVFVVTASGNVADVVVENRKDIHPKLAAEAERVVGESPRWKPATYHGKKVPKVFIQPISFGVSR